jgi:TM2 domain-containing membrane protein YozV
MKQCNYCGNQNESSSNYCAECGINLGIKSQKKLTSFQVLGSESNKYIKRTSYKQPSLAFLISIIFPGFGQIYLGQVIPGVALFCATVIGSFFTLGFKYIIAGVITGIFAANTAKKINTGQKVRKAPIIGWS